jgi:hypothetical protein
MNLSQLIHVYVDPEQVILLSKHYHFHINHLINKAGLPDDYSSLAAF